MVNTTNADHPRIHDRNSLFHFISCKSFRRQNLRWNNIPTRSHRHMPRMFMLHAISDIMVSLLYGEQRTQIECVWPEWMSTVQSALVLLFMSEPDEFHNRCPADIIFLIFIHRFNISKLQFILHHLRQRLDEQKIQCFFPSFEQFHRYSIKCKKKIRRFCRNDFLYFQYNTVPLKLKILILFEK